MDAKQHYHAIAELIPAGMNVSLSDAIVGAHVCAAVDRLTAAVVAQTEEQREFHQVVHTLSGDGSLTKIETNIDAERVALVRELTDENGALRRHVTELEDRLASIETVPRG